jgi:hypothetical protein
MSLLLIIAGAALNYFGWRLLLRIQDRKLNRHFREWWTRGETEEETEGLRIINGSLFITALIGVGMLLIIAGVVNFFA